MTDRDIERQNNFLLQGYAKLIRLRLRDLKISGVSVSSTPVNKAPDALDPLRTLVFTEFDESALGMMVSADNRLQRAPVSFVIAYPRVEGSSLSYSESTETFWTDSFYMCDRGRFFPVVLNEPRQVGLLDTMMRERKPVVKDFGFVQPNMDLYYLANSKPATRQILEAAGINIPRGDLIPYGSGSAETAQRHLKKILTGYAPEDEIVLKGAVGERSERVGIFGVDERREHGKFIRRMLSLGQDILVEERLDPSSSDYYGVFVNAGMEPSEADMNVRSLVTVDANPKVMASEVRFAPRSRRPVGISTGAHAANIGDVYTAREIDEFNEVSVEAARALVRAAKGEADAYGFLGLDLMRVKDGYKKYVYEANFGRVGGIGTLLRINNGGFLSFIQDTYPL